ncbi:MAG TPA: hypothetical protein ENJ89_09170 [Caldithrix abyssi]|uniref:Zinc-regulated TonB-dependent outer membrane receptor n=1 Tax=Caldithrix abyssi TaxID=187145 RepID=A0A7V5PR28_CALAY|nr:hypothetical protein [Caldithrix abyssi]
MRFSISLLMVFLTGTLIYGQQNKPVVPDSVMKQLRALRQRIDALEQQQAESELEKLKEEALKASEQTKEETAPRVFKSGQRSLQAINPEISVTGDQFFQGVINSNGFTEEARTGGYFRVLGLHIQSNLDPFSLAKIAVEITPEGVELGEAYVTWTNVFTNLSLTAGKFRQQFGVVNRWHAHSLDQFDFPLAMTTILGEEGLNQIGFSLDWLMPSLIAQANTLTLQITNGQNDQLFAGSAFSFPVVLGHLKNYYDLNPDTYLEWGITGMAGYNNFRGFADDRLVLKANQLTKVTGLDLTLFWEPVNRAHYHSFLWRTEFYYADKEQLNDRELTEHITAGGFYTNVDYRFNERWYAGLRYDYTQPFTVKNAGRYISQIVPYVTWWQSHWVRFRLQLNYKSGNALQKADTVVRLQLTWAAGPHKHERY